MLMGFQLGQELVGKMIFIGPGFGFLLSFSTQTDGQTWKSQTNKSESEIMLASNLPLNST